MPDEGLVAERERRLHPMYLVFAFFSTVRGFALPLIFLLIWRRSDIDSVALLFVIPSIIFAVLRYVSLRYSLGVRELRVRGGLIFRFERHIPYQRIQNLKLHRSLFHRLFGLSGLTIETASGEELEAKLDVLSMRDVRFIEARIRDSDEVGDLDKIGSPATTERPESDGTLNLSLLDILLAGLASNRGLTLILAGCGFLWEQVGNERIIQEFSVLREVVHFMGVPKEYFSGLGLMISIPLLLIFLFLATRLTSMAWSLLKYGRFQLQLIGDELRLRQGIFTEVASTIPRNRIQTTTMKRTAINRYMGRVEIQFSTAGGAEGDEAALRSIPSLEVSRLPQALGMLQQEALSTILQSIAAKPRCWRSLFLRAVSPVFLATTLLLLFSRIEKSLILGLAMAMAATLVVVAKRRIRVMSIGMSATDVIVTRGWPTFEARRLPFSKLQSVSVSESPFDRRRGTISLELDYAGATFGASGIKVEFVDRQQAMQLAEIIGERAAQAHFVWN